MEDGFLYPKSLSPVASWRKFSTVLGTSLRRGRWPIGPRAGRVERRSTLLVTSALHSRVRYPRWGKCSRERGGCGCGGGGGGANERGAARGPLHLLVVTAEVHYHLTMRTRADGADARDSLYPRLGGLESA